MANDTGMGQHLTRGMSLGAGGLQLTINADAPSDSELVEGRIYGDTDHKCYYYNGSSWVDMTASGGSATAYDDIGDPDASGSISFAGYTGTYTSSTANWGGLIMSNTATNPTTGATLLTLGYTADGDAEAVFLTCKDNSSAEAKFTVGLNGLTTIAGNATGTDALVITAGDIELTSGIIDINIATAVDAINVNDSKFAVVASTGNTTIAGTLTTGNITGTASAHMTITSGATNQNMTINGAGSGTMNIANTSTGNIAIGNGSVAACGITATTTTITGDLTVTGTATIGTVVQSAVQPATGNLTLNGATGANSITIGNLSTGGIIISDNMTINQPALFSTTTQLNFCDTDIKVYSSTDGKLDIDSDTEIEITTATFDLDTSTATTIDATAFSIDGTSSSNVSVTGAQLQISTLTSGELDITAAALLDINAGANIDIDVTGTFAMDSTGAATIASVGASSWANSTGNLTISTTTSGTIGIQSIGTVDIDGVAINIDGTGAVSVAGVGASDITISTGNLTLETTTSGGILLTSVGVVTLSGTTMSITGSGILDVDVVGASHIVVASGNLNIQTTTSGDIDINAIAEVDINAGTTLDILAAGAMSIDATGASNLSATSGNLTVSTITSGNLVLSSAGGVDIDAGGTGTVAINTANDAVADATAAAAITITSGNKTAGTGAGGAINLVAGTGFGGGAAGTIGLQGNCLVSSTNKIQFYDTGIYINSSADGKLVISSDGAGVDDITIAGSVTVPTTHVWAFTDAASVTMGGKKLLVEHQVSVPIYATLNVATSFGLLPVIEAVTITAMEIGFVVVPASALGTVTLEVYNRDGGAASDNLLNAATYDLEGLTNMVAAPLTLTATGADLILAATDFVYCTITSNNADMTGGTGGCITIKYTVN